MSESKQSESKQSESKQTEEKEKVNNAARFDITSDKERTEALQYMEENGYVIFKQVASEDELKQARNLMWEFFEGLNRGVKRDDVKTWNKLPAYPTNGIVAGFGVGQSAFVWYVRTLPKVKACFSAVWGGDTRLLVSFDGCGIFRPWTYNRDWRTEPGWYHVDQNPRLKPGRHSVQGLVSLYDCDETTGSLVVMPRSHRLFETLQSLKPQSNDFVPLPDDHPLQRAESRLVRCRAGDLVLWDSRTIHCNSPATTPLHQDVFDSVSKQWRLLRAVAYVCMTPLRLAPTDPVARKKLIQLRLQAFKHLQTTSHWPHEFHETEDITKAMNSLQLTPQIELLITGT